MVLVLLVSLNFIFAFEMESDSYSVGSYHMGIASNTPEGTVYSSRDTLDYQQGGNDGDESDVYSFNLGWLEKFITEDEESVAEEVSPGGEVGSGGGSATIKQFDIKILDFESPINLGELFDFMYFVKGVGDINHDVDIDFWVEKNGTIITSGSDVIFMGSNEEKTEAGSLFMPSDVASGEYKFVIKVSYGNLKAEAHRTIELTVIDGEAVIDSLFDIRFILEETLLENSDELSAITFFENFGSEITPVNLMFSILDERRNEIYREEEIVAVETERVLRKSFKDLDLDSGKYVLVLKTVYGDNVVDEFEQEFEIKREVRKISLYVKIVVGTLILLIISLVLWLLIKKIFKKKEKDLKRRVKVFKKPMKERIKIRAKKSKKKSHKSIHKKIEREIGNL